MQPKIRKIGYWLEVNIRYLCSLMSPGLRITIVLSTVIFFAGVNFYLLFRAINSIVRDGKVLELIQTPKIAADSDSLTVEPDSLQKEMHDFFDKQFNSGENDRTTKQKRIAKEET